MLNKNELHSNILEQVQAINDLDFYTYYNILNNHFIVHGYKDNVKNTFDIPLQYFKGDLDTNNIKMFSLFMKDDRGDFTEIKTNDKYRKDLVTYKQFKNRKQQLLKNDNQPDLTAFLRMDVNTTTFTNLFKKTIDPQKVTVPKVCKFDIETDDLEEHGPSYDNLDNPVNEIYSIVVHNNYDDKVYVFTHKEWNYDESFDEFYNELSDSKTFRENKHHKEILSRLQTLQSRTVSMVYENEIEMLKGFIKHLRKEKYDIYCGWNNQAYDNPYIYKRIEYLLNKEEADKFSPYNYVRVQRTQDEDNPDDVSYKLEIGGVENIDYKLLFQQMIIGNRDSFSLEAISDEELGVGKLKFDGTYTNFYETNFNRFILYNIIDVIWIDEIDRKLKMIYLNMLKSFEGNMRFEKTVTNISLLHQTAIYKMMIDEKKVYANDHPIRAKGSYAGGYCEAHADFYKFLMCKDFTSLYPSIMMLLNLSVETILSNEELLNMTPEDVIKTLNKNHNFTKQFKGIITKYTERGFLKRLEYKGLMKSDPENKEQWDLYQYVQKILINSLYGFMGFKDGYFYNLDNASIITRTARHLIKLMSSVITDLHKDYAYLNKFYNFKKYKLTFNGEKKEVLGIDKVVVQRGDKVIKTLVMKLQPTDKLIEIL